MRETPRRNRVFGKPFAAAVLLFGLGGDPLPVGAGETRAADTGARLVALLERAEKGDNRVHRGVVAEIVRDYAHYAPHIERVVTAPGLSSYKEFILADAIRTYQRERRQAGTAPPNLAPGLETWLLFRTGTGDSALRLHAESILRANATAQTIDRFLATKVRIRQHADRVGVKAGQQARLHYALSGADILYDFARDAVDGVRRSGTLAPRERRQRLDDALRALSVAWSEHAGVARRYRVEFVRALYGKALVWIAAADQIAAGRLVRPVSLGNENNLSPAAALDQASQLFTEFDRETASPALRDWYLYPHHFQVVAACHPADYAAEPAGIKHLYGCIAANSP